MEYLLDTHILIWYMSNDKKLSKEAKEIIKILPDSESKQALEMIADFVLERKF